MQALFSLFFIFFESLAKDLLAQLPVNPDDEIDGALSQAAGAPSLNDEFFPSEFTVFPKLPIEIRIKVWKLAQTGADLLVFDCTTYGAPPFSGRIQAENLLAVCCESRSEILKIFKQYKPTGAFLCDLRPEINCWSDRFPGGHVIYVT
jgi:hypothetical protein